MLCGGSERTSDKPLRRRLSEDPSDTVSVRSDNETVKMSTVRRSTGTDNQRRAAIYCCVSTAKQEDERTSLESQEDACRAHAEALGYQVGPVFREVPSGADLFGRDQMTALRETVRYGEVGIVIA